ncbi:MAG: amidohydrolase family protein [Flavobacteriales bacterium]|nr:amidohydrolase family protein [Flavobacteriales bacterium]
MRNFFLFALLCFTVSIRAQELVPVNGPHQNAASFYCFTNAVLHIAPGKSVENGTLIIKEGKIIAAGTGIAVPKGAVVVDLKGKHVYPSFVDLYASYGMPENKGNNQPFRGGAPQYESSKKGAYYWNESIHPETRAAEIFSVDAKSAGEYRSLGFGAVLTHGKDGIARGTSTFVLLGEKRDNEMLLIPDAAQNFSFRKGSSQQIYPQSLMGGIALLTQFYHDAKWYASLKSKKEENLSLKAFLQQKDLPAIFDAGDKLNILRADKLGDAFGIQYIMKGSGKEYQRLADIKSTSAALIIPLNFPDAYDVEDVYEAMNVSLEDMKHWELAPWNPAAIQSAGIKMALTLSDLKDKKAFLTNLRKAIKYGWNEDDALRALTTTPAELIGAEKLMGTLEPGKIANFIICSESVFSENSVMYQNWIAGEKFVLVPDDVVDVRGDYDLNIQNNIYTVNVKGDVRSPQASVKVDTTVVKAKIAVQNKNISLAFTLKDKNYKGAILLSGVINFDSGTWDGNAQLPDGSMVKWNAVRKSKLKEERKENQQKDSLQLGKVWYPFMAYGNDTIPKGIPVLIKNTTVWTNESDGILKNTDVLIRDGKIFKVGKILDVVDKNTWVIDGTGKHLTCGIIDEHSHIAISGGVNEGSHAVTAEVSIADVVNSEDVNIYRQLAGGVTTAQLLHGSANPIGGRSAIIKLRWGKTPEEMKVEGADGFIKFALGENVKQSNWGEQFSTRYPQTRMGVEQTYYDAFFRARHYEQEMKKHEHSAKGKNHNGELFRRDIQLDVLVDILNSKRFVTCHSYVQSEINMLMKVADSMGFHINTFTHILEGYKVADKMKLHGVAASTFSDWWAYKYEVMEAIPYNAALLASMGVLTGINSDDAEMARRLNQEAAKAVKYGAMSEEEAWKLVTLNPAKMLHLDHKIGSVKVGKEADIVLWSDSPLSVYAKAEKTFIDGVCYYDREKEDLMRERIQVERLRLINKMLQAKLGGAPTQRAGRRERGLYHCETMEDYNHDSE